MTNLQQKLLSKFKQDLSKSYKKATIESARLWYLYHLSTWPAYFKLVLKYVTSFGNSKGIWALILIVFTV